MGYDLNHIPDRDELTSPRKKLVDRLGVRKVVETAEEDYGSGAKLLSPGWLAERYLEEAQRYTCEESHNSQLLSDVEDALGVPEEFRSRFRRDIIERLEP